MAGGDEKLKLQGFNNLTKTLSFNVYDVCYIQSMSQQQAYSDYIDERYSAEHLTRILGDVTSIIGANILNIACQDYEPQGTSVSMLLSEEAPAAEGLDNTATPGPLPEAIVAHLDKSHTTAHTYPETHPQNGINTFRADIDVSTCGRISPLKALNYLLNCFEPAIVIMDYRVRGFARNEQGGKVFIDHEMNSIQNYIPSRIAGEYEIVDANLEHENIFHTRMVLKDFNVENYLFGIEPGDLVGEEQQRVTENLRREINELFYGRNFNKLQ